MPSYDVATRSQALTLKLVGYKNAEIESITGMRPNTVNTLLRKAIARGLDPTPKSKILDYHVEDSQRSGRPTKQTEKVISDVLSKVRGD